MRLPCGSPTFFNFMGWNSHEIGSEKYKTTEMLKDLQIDFQSLYSSVGR